MIGHLYIPVQDGRGGGAGEGAGAKRKLSQAADGAAGPKKMTQQILQQQQHVQQGVKQMETPNDMMMVSSRCLIFFVTRSRHVLFPSLGLKNLY